MSQHNKPVAREYRYLAAIASLCLFGVFGICRPALAALNPATYTSPSGQFSLYVDPSEIDGQGEGSYRLSRNGKPVWEKKYPFTLCHAAVTEDGVTAGYAYTNGVDGFAPRRHGGDQTHGKFDVVILGPDGTVRLNDSCVRQSFILDSPPRPLAKGMFIDTQRSWLFAEVDVDDKGERWWIYDLATGRELAKLDMTQKDTRLRWVVRATAVLDTPLVLIHWWEYDEQLSLKKNPGGAFTLMDFSNPAEPKTVWKKMLPSDYAVADTAEEPRKSDDLMDEIRADSAIVRCDQPRRFSLRFVAENQRVDFQIQPGDQKGDWQVTETGRQPYQPATRPAVPDAADVPIPTTALTHLGRLWLGEHKPPAAQPVRDIFDFDIDDRGRIGFIRDDGRDTPSRIGTFVLVTPDGKTVVDGIRPDNSLLNESDNKIAWISGDRWMVTTCKAGVEQKARAWFIDVGAAAGARVTPIDKFDSPGVQSIAPTGDGGFMALTERSYKYTSTDHLTRFDAGGAARWSVGTESKGDAALFSPADVAVDPSQQGTVAVLDRIKGDIQLFDAAGTFTRRIELKKTLGQESSYPSNVRFERNGGIVLLDFDGTPPVWRLTADGKPREKITPHFRDGQTFLVRDIRLAPDDRIWTTDGQRLLCLGDSGEVVITLGERKDADRPENLAAAAIGPEGRIYTASSTTPAVKVFDASGKLLQTMSGLPTDFGSDGNARNITIAADGSVYMSAENAPYLHFKPDGTRIGWEKLDLDGVVETWHFVPVGDKRWVLGYRGIWLVNENGNIREIQRQPDHNWLAQPQALAVAKDGSAAVVADYERGRDPSAARLNIYAADGSPVRTIPLPGARWVSEVVYDGKRAIVSGSGNLILVDVASGSLRLLNAPPAPTDTAGPTIGTSFRSVLLSADGKELWLLHRGREGVWFERYALPGVN